MFLENNAKRKLFLNTFQRARGQETMNQFKIHFENTGVLI